jgi:hypothetical protein
VFHQVGLWPVLGVHKKGTSLGLESSSEKISWFSSGVQSFKVAAQDAYSADMFF